LSVKILQFKKRRLPENDTLNSVHEQSSPSELDASGYGLRMP
jgi:hypothetical protein